MVYDLQTIIAMNNEAVRRHYERTPETGTPTRRTIAIDYDDTFTTDPGTWSAICHALSFRHDVICVSARDNTPEHYAELRAALPPCVQKIILSQHTPKRTAATLAGYHVDIWIDDRPEGISHTIQP